MTILRCSAVLLPDESPQPVRQIEGRQAPRVQVELAQLLLGVVPYV